MMEMLSQIQFLLARTEQLVLAYPDNINYRELLNNLEELYRDVKESETTAFFRYAEEELDAWIEEEE